MAIIKPGDRVVFKNSEKPYTGTGGRKVHPGDKGTVIHGTGDTSSTRVAAIVEVQFDSGVVASMFSCRLEPLDPSPAFYLVHSDRGPSTKAHPTREAAEAEALQLAVRNPGTDFYVMAPVAKASVNRPVVTLVTL